MPSDLTLTRNTHEHAQPSFPLIDEAKLIQLLYASLTDKEGFHPFLNELATSINATAGTLLEVNRHRIRVEHIWYTGFPPEVVDWYLENNMIEHDVVLNHAVKQMPGIFQSALPLLEDFDKKADYDRWDKDMGMLDAAWMVVHTTEHSVIVLSMQRSIEQGPYSQEELQKLNWLVPFVRQSVQLYHQTNHQRDLATSLTGIVNALQVPTIILNDQAKVIHANDDANMLINNEPMISIDNHRLIFTQAEARDSLMIHTTGSIQASLGQQEYSSNTVFITRKNKSKLIVCISPIVGLNQQRGGAMISIYDPDQRPLPSAALIAEYFSLTPAEAQLCEDLAAGFNLKEISERQHKTESTLRSYLNRVFQKTNTQRQPQLVGHILSALIR